MAEDQKALDALNTEFVLAVRKFPEDEQPRLMHQYTEMLQNDGAARARSFLHAMEMSGPAR